MVETGARCRKLGGAIGLAALALGASPVAVLEPAVLSAAIRAGLGHFDNVVGIDPRPIELRIDGTSATARHLRSTEEQDVRRIAVLIIEAGK